MKDVHGIERGKCTQCECNEFTCETPGRVRCEYCDHPPGRHVRIVELGECLNPECIESGGNCRKYEAEGIYAGSSCAYCGCEARSHKELSSRDMRKCMHGMHHCITVPTRCIHLAIVSFLISPYIVPRLFIPIPPKASSQNTSEFRSQPKTKPTSQTPSSFYQREGSLPVMVYVYWLVIDHFTQTLPSAYFLDVPIPSTWKDIKHMTSVAEPVPRNTRAYKVFCLCVCMYVCML